MGNTKSALIHDIHLDDDYTNKHEIIVYKEFNKFVDLLMQRFENNKEIDLTTGETKKFHAIDFYSSLREIIIVSSYTYKPELQNNLTPLRL